LRFNLSSETLPPARFLLDYVEPSLATAAMTSSVEGRLNLKHGMYEVQLHTIATGILTMMIFFGKI
jgi:hypothetical protein